MLIPERPKSATTTPEGLPGTPSITYLVAACLALALGLTLLDPDSSQGLTFPKRLLYWVAHTGVALAMLIMVQHVLKPLPQFRKGAWLTVAIAGFLGACLFVPAAALLERAFFQEAPSGLLKEASEAIPQVLVFWLLLNLPFLLRVPTPRRRRVQESETTRPHNTTVPARPSSNTADADNQEAPSEKNGAGSPPLGYQERSTSGAAPSLLARLPPSLGKDVLAISSELHYLRIYTSQGNALLLGSLKVAVESGALPPGLRIHRSHWVATTAVVRLQRINKAYACLLTNGLELPVSRRRALAVRRQFEGAELGSTQRPARPRRSG